MVHELLGLAYSIIENNKIELSEEFKSKYSDKLGIFVKIKKNNLLRGQAGYIETLLPLWKSVITLTKVAAFHDDEFPPVGPQEIKQIKIELILITNIQLFNNTLNSNQGLFLESLTGSAILFPDEIKEFSDNLNDTLELLAQKANLNSWKDKSVRIYVFDTEKIK